MKNVKKNYDMQLVFQIKQHMQAYPPIDTQIKLFHYIETRKLTISCQAPAWEQYHKCKEVGIYLQVEKHADVKKPSLV
jgi:hypothetical protein